MEIIGSSNSLQSPNSNPKFSFEPIVLEESSTGPIGPGRPVDPAIKEIGDFVLEVFRSLSPNSRWQNADGKPFGLPIPDPILARAIQHRDGTQNIDKKANAQNFATRIKQYCQRALPEDSRDNIQVGVVPHITANGPVYTLAVRRFAPLR